MTVTINSKGDVTLDARPARMSHAQKKLCGEVACDDGPHFEHEVERTPMSRHDHLVELGFHFAKALIRLRKQSSITVEPEPLESTPSGLEAVAESRPHGTGSEMNTVPEE